MRENGFPRDAGNGTRGRVRSTGNHALAGGCILALLLLGVPEKVLEADTGGQFFGLGGTFAGGKG